MTTPTPLTLAEVEAHPEYPHVNWTLKPTRQGLTPVAVGRGGPIKIAWEIHGHGPNHLVFSMGLGSFMSGWQRQTKDFGHTQADKYSVLVLDNRGMGNSDKPLMRYSTSEMARDYLEILEHVGWTEERSLHVVGISMGGMVAQEIAFLIPTHIASLLLLSTAARLTNTTGYLENLRNRINLFLPKPLAAQIAQAKRNQFSASWLTAPDDSEIIIAAPFPTNGDRYTAHEMRKRARPDLFSKTGFVCQAVAAGWHHKSAEQLRALADGVGRARIVVAYGTADRMITFPHAQTLWTEMNEGGKEGEEVRMVAWEGAGHVVILERREDLRRLLEEVVERTGGMR